MISLYIPGIYNYLILPRQLRSVERGLFMPKDPTKSLIRVHNRDAINYNSNFITPKVISQELSLGIDMTKILEGHLGLQVVWQPFDIPKPEEAHRMLKNLAVAGISFVPGIGPLASACFTVFLAIVRHHEKFEEEGPLELGGELLRDTAAAAEAIADYLPKNSAEGKLMGFLSNVVGAVGKVAPKRVEAQE